MGYVPSYREKGMCVPFVGVTYEQYRATCEYWHRLSTLAEQAQIMTEEGVLVGSALDEESDFEGPVNVKKLRQSSLQRKLQEIPEAYWCSRPSQTCRIWRHQWQKPARDDSITNEYVGDLAKEGRLAEKCGSAPYSC